MFGNALVRGMFLIIIFPRIISNGRKWFTGGGPPGTETPVDGPAISSSATTIIINNEDGDAEVQTTKSKNESIPTSPRQFPAAEGLEVPQEPILSSQVSHQQDCRSTTTIADHSDEASSEGDVEDWGIEFDLFFVRWSLVIDSMVTFFAGFSSQGWHVYLGKHDPSSLSPIIGIPPISPHLCHICNISSMLTSQELAAGFVLPFASGSAPAAKGLLSELCPPEQRGDALSGITLVESMATLLTQGLFGIIFAAMSEIDQPRLTFFCNAVSVSSIQGTIRLCGITGRWLSNLVIGSHKRLQS